MRKSKPMKPTGNENINTKTYWDMIYENSDKRERYAAQGTSTAYAAGRYIAPTQRFAKAVSFVKDGDKVLDIGCGVGVFTALVKQQNPLSEVWGVDISAKAIADNTLEHPKITYKQHYVGRTPPFPQQYYDIVFSGEVLEHIDQPETLLNEAYNALKPGGIFILTTPSGSSIQSQEHVWEFDHQDVEDLYLQAGFDRVEFVYLDNLEHMYVIFAVGYKPL